MPPTTTVTEPHLHVAVKNELNGCILLRAKDLLMLQDPMRKDDQQLFIKNQYFGHPPTDVVSGLDTLLSSKDEFDFLFEDDGDNRVLKKEFYIYDSLRATSVLGTFITKAALGKKTFHPDSEWHQPRQLFSKCESCWATAKKILAIAYEKKHFDPTTGILILFVLFCNWFH